MTAPLAMLAPVAAALWVTVLALPWRPWRNGEVLEADEEESEFDYDYDYDYEVRARGRGHTPLQSDLSDVTVLMPARNEAAVVGRTLRAAAAQGAGIGIIMIDDNSTDGTAARAREAAGDKVRVIRGAPLAEGWSGKLWALEQGRAQVRTPYTLLLDADVELAPGTVTALRARMRREGAAFISLMAEPQLERFWERALMPAFVYFFKLLYPFRLAGSPRSRVAAAAGGCVLLETGVLEAIGGFGAIRGELIDDCALAGRVKAAGHPIWIGLTHAARSVRPTAGLGEIWNMVARTAYLQLRCSVAMLLVCTAMLGLSFGVPVAAAAAGTGATRAWGAGAWLAMAASYLPTLRFYRRGWAWALCLPGVAFLYLMMTWTSAVRCWRGERSRWKERVYRAEGGGGERTRPSANPGKSGRERPRSQ